MNHFDDLEEEDASLGVIEVSLEDEEIFELEKRKSMAVEIQVPKIGKQKIADFVESNQITLERFWQSKKNHASCQDLKKFCEDLGLKITKEDEIALRMLMKPNLVIEKATFANLIWKNGWEYNNNNKGQCIKTVKLQKQNNVILKEELENNKTLGIKNEGKRIRPSSSTVSIKRQQTRPQSAVSKYYVNNKSKEYLLKQKQKERDIENKLQMAIKKAKNEYEYELLLKMGEANDLNKELQSVVTYRAYKNAQGNLKVRVFNLDKFEKEINLEEFQRQFNNIKKKYNETKKISVWQVLSGGKKGEVNNFYDVASKKNVKKSERQKELVSILTETMNLTNVLKEQLKILKAQGIVVRT